MGGAKKRARAAPAAAAAAAAPKPATWHWCCDLRKTLDEKDASMWKKYGGTSPPWDWAELSPLLSDLAHLLQPVGAEGRRR
eukprot:gene1173-2399_t